MNAEIAKIEQLPPVVMTQAEIGAIDMILPTVKIHQKSTQGYQAENAGKFQVAGHSDTFYDTLNICVCSIDKKLFASNKDTFEVYQVLDGNAKLEDHGYKKLENGDWFHPNFKSLKISLKYIYDVIVLIPGKKPVPAKMYVGGASTPTAKLINTKIIQHNTRYFTLSSVYQTDGMKEWYNYVATVLNGVAIADQKAVVTAVKELQLIGSDTQADTQPEVHESIGFSSPDQDVDDIPF